MSRYRRFCFVFSGISVLILIIVILLGMQVGVVSSQDMLDRDVTESEAFSDTDKEGQGNSGHPANVTDANGQVELHDNGPFITCKGCYLDGSDASEVQTFQGMLAWAFGHQVKLGIWVADDFMISDDEGWSIEELTFYPYQENSGTSSTITLMNWKIYSGKPGSDGVVIIASGSGLDATGWTNAYRTANFNYSDKTAPIMYGKMGTNGLYLPKGAYWLAWQADGTLTTGPWTIPITIMGQKDTGNGLQSTNDAATWAAVEDFGSKTPQGFPFTIEGRVGGTLSCNGPDVTFDIGLPTDWATKTTTGPVYWTTTDDLLGCNEIYNVAGSEPAACASSNTTNSSGLDYDTETHSNYFDLSSATSANLSLLYRHRWLYNSVFDIDVSTNFGQTWTNVFSDNSGNYPGPGGDSIDINLAPYLGEPTVMVRFRYYGDDFDWYTQVDDVGLDCTFEPDIFVDPLHIGLTQYPGTVTKQLMDISNDGGASLDWFIEESHGQECSSSSDIPWLTLAPSAGVTAAGDASTVEVTYDSRGLSPGIYAGYLCVYSNDPNAGTGNGKELVVVDVEMYLENGPIYLPVVVGKP